MSKKKKVLGQESEGRKKGKTTNTERFGEEGLVKNLVKESN